MTESKEEEVGRAPESASDEASPAEPSSGIARRDFLRAAGIGAGTLAVSGSLGSVLTSCQSSPYPQIGRGQDVVVIGAGAFGGWTALRLREMGARVTLVDLYGPGNSRSTSGDETRGIRTSYANRDQWCSWAARALERWKEFDEEWAATPGERLFYPTGDLIMRDSREGQIEEIEATFQRNGIEHEILTPDEISYRWPQIRLEGIGAGIFETGAGVGRARAACRRVAKVFEMKGGEVKTGRAELGERSGGRLRNIVLDADESLSADLYVFALGPWFPKAFPEIMGERIRITTLGHVYYFGPPPGDDRFSFPNMPSFGLPGVTGWPALPPDNRGIRVRTGGHSGEDPDTSVRWIAPEYHERPRAILADHFPELADQPIVETRACHYESSSTRNWIIDRHPELDNVWFAGGGSAEGFKFGPVIGDLIAGRVLDNDLHPELADEFRLDDDVAMDPSTSSTEYLG